MKPLYTLLDTTNIKFKYLEGTDNTLDYDKVRNVYWFGNFHTSKVKDTKETDNIREVITLNSVYKFKRIN